MIKSIILGFGTVGLIYDQYSNTSPTKEFYKTIYGGPLILIKDFYEMVKVPFHDMYSLETEKELKKLYNAIPSKETVGGYISYPISSVYNAIPSKETVGGYISYPISSVYNAIPSKETVGGYISSSVNSVYGAAQTIINDGYGAAQTIINDGYGAAQTIINDGYGAAQTGTSDGYGAAQTIINDGYGAAKTVINDGYSGIKTLLRDIVSDNSTLIGIGSGLFAGTFFGDAISKKIPIGFGAGMISKVLFAYISNNKIEENIDKTSNEFIKNSMEDFSSKLNEFLNGDKALKEVYEYYKDDVFTFNSKNLGTFKDNKNQLKSESLDEIEEQVNIFEIKDFCDEDVESNIHYTILHYTRKVGKNTLEKGDKLSELNRHKETDGYKFYETHYKEYKVKNDTKDICELRAVISKQDSDGITESNYKSFCNNSSEEPICSDFVKDVIFPELVDA
jgi:hypothetical protein